MPDGLFVRYACVARKLCSATIACMVRNLSIPHRTNIFHRSAIGAQEGTNETPNKSNLNLAASYIDAPKSYADNTNHFDDFVVRPSVMTVINRAMLGPRAHN